MHLFVPCMRYWCRVSSSWCQGLAAESALNNPWTSFNVFRYLAGSPYYKVITLLGKERVGLYGFNAFVYLFCMHYVLSFAHTLMLCLAVDCDCGPL